MQNDWRESFDRLWETNGNFGEGKELDLPTLKLQMFLFVAQQRNKAAQEVMDALVLEKPPMEYRDTWFRTNSPGDYFDLAAYMLEEKKRRVVMKFSEAMTGVLSTSPV